MLLAGLRTSQRHMTSHTVWLFIAQKLRWDKKAIYDSDPVHVLSITLALVIQQMSKTDEAFSDSTRRGNTHKKCKIWRITVLRELGARVKGVFLKRDREDCFYK